MLTYFRKKCKLSYRCLSRLSHPVPLEFNECVQGVREREICWIKKCIRRACVRARELSDRTLVGAGHEPNVYAIMHMIIKFKFHYRLTFTRKRALTWNQLKTSFGSARVPLLMSTNPPLLCCYQPLRSGKTGGETSCRRAGEIRLENVTYIMLLWVKEYWTSGKVPGASTWWQPENPLN